MGIALTSCTPPTRGTPLFEIADDEMEVGIGIHGEPGRQRTKLVSANEIVDLLLDAIVPDLPFKAGDEVALMVNGLGGTPISELYLLYGIAHKKLAAKGIKVFRSYVGEYCTSLEMAGAHISLLKVDDEIKEMLLAPADSRLPRLLIPACTKGPARRAGPFTFVRPTSAARRRSGWREAPGGRCAPARHAGRADGVVVDARRQIQPIADLELTGSLRAPART